MAIAGEKIICQKEDMSGKEQYQRKTQKGLSHFISGKMCKIKAASNTDIKNVGLLVMPIYGVLVKLWDNAYSNTNNPKKSFACVKSIPC